MIPEQPCADRLSRALRDFGLGVVTMQEHGTPVPYGHFWVNAMCAFAGTSNLGFRFCSSARRTKTGNRKVL